MLQLTALSQAEVEAIHQATLRILSEAGVALGHAGARELLTGAGARVQGDRVFMPPDLVEWAVVQCPATVTIRGREGEAATLGDGNLHWHNVGGARDVYDGASRWHEALDFGDVMRIGLDQICRHDAVFQDATLAIDVLEEKVERPHALFHPNFDL